MLALLVTLLLSPASADDPPEETPVDFEEYPEEHWYPELTKAASGIDLVHAAVARRRSGDFEGARLLLERALERDESLTVEVAYQRANLLALERDYAAAREAFAAIAGHASHRTDDARFRVAELTGVLGDPEAALEGLDALKPWRRFEPADRAKIELNYGAFQLDAGDAKKARKQLTKALERTEPNTVSFYEAKAWAFLAHVRLDEADTVPFEGSQRKLRKRVWERMARIRHGQEAVSQAIALEEPEWILHGLMRLAASIELFGDDLLSAAEPTDLTDDQRAAYREGLREEAQAAWQQAYRFLDEAVAMAEQLELDSGRVGPLRARRDRLAAKVGAL